MSDSLVAHVRATPWLAELLARRFDFDLDRTDPVEEVRLANGEALTPIAGDSAGGTFLLTPSGAIAYAGSEGEGGLIALHVRDALALVVGLPNLHDALSGPLDGELRGALAEAGEYMRQEDAGDALDGPDLDEARALVREELDLPEADGPTDPGGA